MEGEVLVGNVTLPQPPDPLEFFNVSSALDFWSVQTFGLFDYVMPVLLVISAFFRTRSIGVALIASSLVLAWLGYMSVLTIIIAVSLAGLIYYAVYRGSA